MKNERGVTLVESLAVIILLAMVSIILFSIMNSGFKNFDRTSTKQKLQQEGNYITEVIRNEYLSGTTSNIELAVDNSKKELQMNGNVISTGFTYVLKDTSNKIVSDLSISQNEYFHLLLNIANEGHSYEINTTLTKLK